MNGKTLKQKLLGTWDTRTIVGVAIGTVMFGVLMNLGSINVAAETSLTSAYVVPAIVGALFGPLPAALSAGVGNVFADLIGGWGFWFDWSIGNFVVGYFAGLVGLFGADIENGVFTVKHAVIYAILCVAGCAIGFGVITPFLTYLWYSSELSITWIETWAAIVSDATVLIIVGIPVLFALSKRNARGTDISKEN